MAKKKAKKKKPRKRCAAALTVASVLNLLEADPGSDSTVYIFADNVIDGKGDVHIYDGHVPPQQEWKGAIFSPFGVNNWLASVKYVGSNKSGGKIVASDVATLTITVTSGNVPETSTLIAIVYSMQ